MRKKTGLCFQAHRVIYNSFGYSVRFQCCKKYHSSVGASREIGIVDRVDSMTKLEPFSKKASVTRQSMRFGMAFLRTFCTAYDCSRWLKYFEYFEVLLLTSYAYG